MKQYEVVLWTAEWCGPCEALKKKGTLKEAIKAFELSYMGPPVKHTIIDVDEKESAADAAKILSMPTVDLLLNGKRIDRAVEPLNAKGYLQRWLKACGK